MFQRVWQRSSVGSKRLIMKRVWEGKHEKRAGAMMESVILWIVLLELAVRIILFVAFAPT